MESRRLRRKKAKEHGIPFEPKYNPNPNHRGNTLVTHKEAYGSGYERFDDKYTKVSGAGDIE